MSLNELDILKWDGALTLQHRTLHHGDYGDVLTLAALVANQDCPDDLDVTRLLLRATSFIVTERMEPSMPGAEEFRLTAAMAIRRVGFMPLPPEKHPNCGESVRILANAPTDYGLVEAAYLDHNGKSTEIFGHEQQNLTILRLCPWLKDLTISLGAERVICRTTDNLGGARDWIKMDLRLSGITAPEQLSPLDVFDQLVQHIARLHTAYLDSCHHQTD